MLDRETRTPTLTGQIIDGRYRVLDLLGEGAMGKVYKAEQVQMGRLCAVKVMKPSDLGEVGGVQRFRREASNAARIVHPNVAAVYDFGEMARERWFLAMEFVEGQPLRSWIDRTEPLSVTRAVEIAVQVADGLAAAHELDIVHRDLKPDNILVAERANGTVLAKIVDFGVAKRAAPGVETLTSSGMVVGTPLYMSPEQFNPNETIDGRSDLYALGCVLFEMLTRERPFPGTSLGDALKRLAMPPRTLAEVRPDVSWPHGLQKVLDALMAIDPADRPGTGTVAATLLLDAVPEAVEMRRRGSAVTVTPTPRSSLLVSSEPAIQRPPDRGSMEEEHSMLLFSPASAVVEKSAEAFERPTSTVHTSTLRRIPRMLVATVLLTFAAVASWQWSSRFRNQGGTVNGSSDLSAQSAQGPSPISEMSVIPMLSDSIAALQRLGEGEEVSIEAARELRRRAGRILPYARTAEDSASILFWDLQGAMALEDSSAFCTVMAQLAPVLAGTTSEKPVMMIREAGFPCGTRM